MDITAYPRTNAMLNTLVATESRVGHEKLAADGTLPRTVRTCLQRISNQLGRPGKARVVQQCFSDRGDGTSSVVPEEGYLRLDRCPTHVCETPRYARGPNEVRLNLPDQ